MRSAPVAAVRPLWLFLILGRVSNLPTVWSNCLAGWILSFGEDLGRLELLSPRFITLCLGATFLYLGGMYLNDAFDARFDREHRRQRPIPAGMTTVTAASLQGAGWLALGWLSLALLGGSAPTLSAALVGMIVLYDAVHKAITFSPLLMALCRVLLYLVAASAAPLGVNGLVLWCALALGAYIVGLSFIARREAVSSAPGAPWWPVPLLAAPFTVALAANGPGYLQPALWVMLVLGLWLFRCLRQADQSPPEVAQTVSGLLAGIIWVDLLAVAGGAPDRLVLIYVFTALFVLARALQRFVPAT